MYVTCQKQERQNDLATKKRETTFIRPSLMLIC